MSTILGAGGGGGAHHLKFAAYNGPFADLNEWLMDDYGCKFSNHTVHAGIHMIYTGVDDKVAMLLPKTDAPLSLTIM